MLRVSAFPPGALVEPGECFSRIVGLRQTFCLISKSVEKCDNDTAGGLFKRKRLADQSAAVQDSLQKASAAAMLPSLGWSRGNARRDAEWRAGPLTKRRRLATGQPKVAAVVPRGAAADAAARCGLTSAGVYFWCHRTRWRVRQWMAAYASGLCQRPVRPPARAVVNARADSATSDATLLPPLQGARAQIAQLSARMGCRYSKPDVDEADATGAGDDSRTITANLESMQAASPPACARALWRCRTRKGVDSRPCTGVRRGGEEFSSEYGK